MLNRTYAGRLLSGLLFASIITLSHPMAPLAASGPTIAHQTDPSIGPHARDSAAHAQDRIRFTPAQSPIIPRHVPQTASNAVSPGPTADNPTLTREVLGFAPYYELGKRSNWNYSLLSTVAYFGLNVNGDGSFNNDAAMTGWNSQELVDVINGAHLAGDRVVLTIKQFNQDTICQIITSDTATQNAVSNTITQIKAKSIEGVNVDFEGNNNQACANGTSPQTAFSAFMTKLSAAVHQQVSGSEVSVDTYSGSASWDGGIFKIGDLAPVVDAFFIMAYDMAFGNNAAQGTSQALPNAPLNGWTYNDTTSVQQYLTKAPASKIILGVPYYGYKWSTTSTQLYASIKPGSGALANGYADIVAQMSCAQQLHHDWDPNGQSPWMSWWSPAVNDPCQGNYGSWREMYYDDPTSLGLKYDLVNANNLRGTGIWELGYQGASQDLWRILAARFTSGTQQFYFAEGFTGGGFKETLSLLMPNQGGVATIDYYMPNQTLTQNATLAAGKVTTVDVNAAVGADKEVSARVTFPGPGVAQRDIHFNTNWVGSTRVVGVSSPATEWNFAEGSTLPAYSEFLTLQNPNPNPTSVELDYFTDSGNHPVKALMLPANSRKTVIVFQGDLGNNPACVPAGAAPSNCGVGPGVLGVSVRVKSALPIVAERPFYVNGFDFGSGAIRDGHDAFGANAAATQWNFAEGTTLPGFNEYLTLQNPGTTPASVQLTYVDFVGHATVKTLTVNQQSRFTVPVFESTYGVGRNVQGVSVQVSSNQPILAERPMYMVWNFGTGAVAGANVIVGARTFGQLVEFPAASTLTGDNAYLTVQNAGGVPAHITATYDAPSGPIVKTLVVPAGTRHTILVFNTTEGAGPGYGPLPILVDSDQPVLIESPSYSSNLATYGSVITMGYPAVRP